MADLFAPPTPEDMLDRKIITLGVLLNRFEEDLERAATLDPKALSLQKAEWIMQDLEDIASRIKDIRNQINPIKSK